MNASELVATGRTALEDGRWEDARLAFEAALTGGDCAEALDGLAEVRHWQGDYAAAIELRERAYAAFRARGETRYPARLAAYHLAFDYAAVHGNFAAAQGWLERGKHLAEAAGDCAERGWVELACVLATEDLDKRERHLAAATEVARRFGDADLEFDALAYTGVALIERGEVLDGMRRLDEAVAAAQGGEVKSATVVGEIYCKMLLACEMTLDVRRAEQWTDAASVLARRSNAAWASAICRTHYGGILTAAGRWSEAERELATAVQIYDGTYKALRSAAVVRLADLRVRQGRLEDAEQLLSGYEHDAYAIGPLARLHLAQGQPELAATLLRRHLASQDDDVLTAPALALLAEAHLATGRVEDAATIASRLTALARTAPTPLVSALAAYVRGRSRTDEGAVGDLEEAVTGFARVGLPLEEARARLELARRMAAAEPAVAVAEAQGALSILDRLGAVRDADAAAALLRSLGVRGRTGPKNLGLLSQRELEVLRLVGLGLSNPEIAARLFISRKTASHHVSNVLAKLGLRNRTEAAAFARSSLPRAGSGH